MKTYNEIFKRILEIIKLSDDMKHNSSTKDFLTIKEKGSGPVLQYRNSFRI